MSDQNTPGTQVLSPEILANQLFDAAIVQYKGDHREATRQVMNFLAESLVYVISATAGDDSARKALLKSMGDSIASAPPSSIRSGTAKP